MQVLLLRVRDEIAVAPNKLAARGKFVILRTFAPTDYCFSMFSSFPQQMKAYRRRHGLSQSDMAVLFGDRSATRVSRYERGQRVPPLTVALTYQAVFDATLADLFPREFADVVRSVRLRAKRLATASLPRNTAIASQRKRSIDKLLAE